MSLDVWFQQDIKHTLLAINQTSLDTTTRLASLAGDTPELQAYRAGYNDALRAVAIAFGIAHPAPTPQALPIERRTANYGAMEVTQRAPRYWEELTDGVAAEANA
jgi:hypothetical protein